MYQVLILSLFVVAIAAAGETGGGNPRPELPVTAATTRAMAIVAQMTNAEKASILNGIKSSAYGDSHNGYYIGNTPAIDRLGIPSVNMQDASQGFRTIDKAMYGQVTSWPCSLAVASTWDIDLVLAWGTALGEEFRAKGANMILGPSINVHRVARNGRNAEYISGEDPYLGSKFVPAYVTGVQSQKVMANIKHYILNNQETNRNLVSSNVGERALQEIYMPPFRAGALAGAASAMCSYNLVNGTHSCGQGATMNSLLKKELNWTGFITSDWGAVHADGYEQAGLDMDQPGTDGFFAPAKLEADQAALDDMAARVITGLITVDAFDNSVCVGGVNCTHYLYEANATSEAHAELARTIAAQSAALLKNEGNVLPLRKGQTIGVVGDACDSKYGALLAWNAGNYYVMGGSGRVVNYATTSILSGLRQRAAEIGATVVSGTEGADVIVTCGATTSSEGADRKDLLVDQDADIKRIVGQATVPVVVLLQGPGALVTASFDAGASAIVSMFLAGQATGLAWADVLFEGGTTPSGRLPVSFPISEADTVPPCPGMTCDYAEGLAVGYRGLAGKAVAYPFGHGLSYTAFNYTLVSTSWGGGGLHCDDGFVACARVRVANTGKVAGAEVVQLYLTFPDSAAEPAPGLKGFHKTSVLAPGDGATVVFGLTAMDLSVWDVETAGFKTATGGFTASFGASSRDLRLTSQWTTH